MKRLPIILWRADEWTPRVQTAHARKAPPKWHRAFGLLEGPGQPGVNADHRTHIRPRHRPWTFSRLALALVLFFIAFPAHAGWLMVGPDYKQPTNSFPPAYKSEELGSWKEGRPLDNVPKGSWWEVFDDPDLNGLESQAIQANQNLKAAVARVQQARALARVARADLMPA